MRKPGTVLMMILFVLVCFKGIIFPYVDQQESTTSPDQKATHMNKLEAKVLAALEALEAQKAVLDNLPTIYIVTPTYQRPEQIPEITRLGQTLMNVPKIHWIVAEDALETNPRVVEFLNFTGIPYTYLLTPMPKKYRDNKKAVKPRGVANRNAGIDWIRNHAKEGVMYLADDDNAYDIRLFEQIRYTTTVSMFPVGLVTHFGLSSPVLKDNKFVGWYDGWIAGRKFPVDMAGFAISVELLLSVPDAMMPYSPGYEETGLLSALKVTPQELEFVADNCTTIYVWHTQTRRNQPSSNNILDPKYDDTNLRQLQKLMSIKK